MSENSNLSEWNEIYSLDSRWCAHSLAEIFANNIQPTVFKKIFQLTWESMEKFLKKILIKKFGWIFAPVFSSKKFLYIFDFLILTLILLNDWL